MGQFANHARMNVSLKEVPVGDYVYIEIKRPHPHNSEFVPAGRISTERLGKMIRHFTTSDAFTKHMDDRQVGRAALSWLISAIGATEHDLEDE